MADDKSNTGGQDRTRINVNEDYELRDWAKKFDTTSEQIREAVKAVGDRAADVEMHLKGSHSRPMLTRKRAPRGRLPEVGSEWLAPDI